MERQDSFCNDTELDATNSHLNTLEDLELPPTLTALDLTANRLRTIEPKLLALTGLIHLSLRQNLLSDASPLAMSLSAPVMQELVLHDNTLEHIPELPSYINLRRFEVSYNRIRSLMPMEAFCADTLNELYAASNKIVSIEGLSKFMNLRVLDLGSNRIRTMDGLESCSGLEELWLGRNRISQIAHLKNMTCLQRLSLQSNRLTTLEGIQVCSQLRELYLSHNGIADAQGVDVLEKLEILDLGNNQIEHLINLEKLTALRDLWVNDNKLDDLANLEVNLEVQKGVLKCIYLDGNPLASREGYRDAVLKMLPSLEQLNADYLLPLAR